MTTIVVNLKGRIHDYGPTLDRAPAGLVYVGRRLTMGGWDLDAHSLHNPYTLREYGTPEAVVAAYISHLLDHPDLLDKAAELRGRTLACWCAPQLCHANALAWYADAPDDEQLAERGADLELVAWRAEQHLLDRAAP